MKKFSLLDKIKIVNKRVASLTNGNPLVVSFEVTLSCNCNCRHCDLGGIRKEEKQIGPKNYAHLVRQLKPLVVQISGGEPLLRKDVVEIAKSIKQFGGLPYTILVSNGRLLTENIYLKLKEAGVNQFSVSLDFPDERHDGFRRHPGLFKHLSETIPLLAKQGFKDIILNSAITRANFKEVIPLAKKAKDWGVMISYSAYTPLRTGNRDYSFEDKESSMALRKNIEELIDFKNQNNCIVTSDTVLLKKLEFLEKGHMPGCKAGINFVVVMPDGKFVPCSMKRARFSDLKELRNKFSNHNSCDGCYVSIRCYSERSLLEEIAELPQYFKIAKRGG